MSSLQQRLSFLDEQSFDGEELLLLLRLRPCCKWTEIFGSPCNSEPGGRSKRRPKLLLGLSSQPCSMSATSTSSSRLLVARLIPSSPLTSCTSVAPFWPRMNALSAASFTSNRLAQVTLPPPDNSKARINSTLVHCNQCLVVRTQPCRRAGQGNDFNAHVD